MPSQKYAALLVDDDATCNFLNATVVSESEAFNQPIVFSDPQVALEYLQRDCLLANRQRFPELILIDVNMPGINGFEFVDKLKKMCHDIFDKALLCFLSSSNNTEDKQRARSLGVERYYEKPLSSEQLEELLTTLQGRF